MNRLSFVAGAAAAFVVAAGWNGLQSAPVGPVAADQTRGMALMSAAVNIAGVLSHGSGAVSATKTGTGQYTVVFDRDIRGCTASGTVADTTTTQNPYPVALFMDINNAINVRMELDRHFHLLVFCHR